MPSFHQCPQCHSNLKVLKTRRRRVATMSLGDITAYEKHLSCSPCRQIYTSEVLDKIVPERCTFAYDVLVHVGKSLFLRHRNSREVCEELAERNIKISPRECRLSGQEVYRFPGPGPSPVFPEDPGIHASQVRVYPPSRRHVRRVKPPSDDGIRFHFRYRSGQYQAGYREFRSDYPLPAR